MQVEEESSSPFESEEEGSLPDDEKLRRKLLQNTTEIFSTPSDPDIETLLRRIKEDEIVLRPKFQRADVWKQKLKSRLVESVLLNLPIPPVFLAEDEDSNKVVVDGQQRLRAIEEFHREKFALTDLEMLKELNGSQFTDLEPKLKRRFLHRVIRVLTIPYNQELDVKFLIFERLNTNTVPLNDQEIRNATLSGPLNDLLQELVKEQKFLELMGVGAPDDRLRHNELILRSLAVRYGFKDYSTPLKLFINNYMKLNRKFGVENEQVIRSFVRAGLTNTELVFGRQAFRRFEPKKNEFLSPVSRAVFELQLISLADFSEDDVRANRIAVYNCFKDLCADTQFIELLTRGVDHRKRFYRRFELWFSSLSKIGLVSRYASLLPDID